MGLKDKKLSEKLQVDSKLTLEKAVTQARQSETVKKQKGILQGTQPDPASVNVDQISKKRGKGGKGKDQKDKPPKNSKPAGKTPETKCTRCLGTPHSKQECPAKDSKCNKCLKKGHWAKACKSPSKKKVGEVYSCPEVEQEGEFFLGQLTEVDMIERNSKGTWKAEVKLNEHAVKFKVDTGADVTVIPPNMYHSLVPKPSLSKCDKTLMGPCKHKLYCLGNFTAKLCVDENIVRELIYVVKDLVASVITGLPASDSRLQQIIEAQEEDPVCRQIKTYCSEGWPDKHSVNDAMKPYWSTRGELTVVQNILLKGTRIVIPSSMRPEILDKIHEDHQGIAKC